MNSAPYSVTWSIFLWERSKEKLCFNFHKALCLETLFATAVSKYDTVDYTCSNYLNNAICLLYDQPDCLVAKLRQFNANTMTKTSRKHFKPCSSQLICGRTDLVVDAYAV